MEWKQIENLMYEASSEGDIRNSKTGRILKQRLNKRGYYLTEIQINKKSTTFEVHRLIAKAFFGEIPKNREIDHIDRIRSNNKITNLRIVTKSENLKNREFQGKPPMGMIEKIIKLYEKGLSTEEIRDCF